MNKIFRKKTKDGGLAVSLSEITAIRHQVVEGNTDLAVEIVTDAGILDAPMSSEELEALQRAWDEAL